MGKKTARQPAKKAAKPAAKKPVEKYGRTWQHRYRKDDMGKSRPAMVKKIKGGEIVKFPSKAYVNKHHPRGSWIS